MASYPKVLFKNEGADGASASLLCSPKTSISIMWDGGASEPIISGDNFFVRNQMFTAAFFDYLIHTKAQQKAAAEAVFPNWEESAEDSTTNFDDDTAAAERTYEEKLANLRKTTEKSKETLLDLATILAYGPKLTEPVESYCSACTFLSKHQEIATPYSWADAYICNKCSVLTAKCSVPGCSSFALRGFGRTGIKNANLPICAEHTHEIPDFEKTNARLADLSHWETIFEYKKTDVKKVAKKGMAIATVASLALPVFYVAAPGVGAAIGVAKGLHGVAAVNHGLALLGGGAVAAGGMGMAGGQLIVTAVGAGLGGVAGMRVATAYLSKDPSFNIEPIRGGEGPAVVFASGFTTEEDKSWVRWKRLIDTAYPDNPVYRVYWGAKELKDLGAFAGAGGAAGFGGAKLAGMAARGAKVAAKNLGAVGWGNAVLGVAKNPWNTAVNRAKQAGSALASILARTDNDHGFILIGHSLGGAMMATAAAALSNGNDETPVIDVHLLGAAHPAKASVDALAGGVKHNIYNYHSLNDQVLQNLYKIGAFGKSAAGHRGFAHLHPRVKNIDVTAIVPGHRKYIDFVNLQKDDSAE